MYTHKPKFLLRTAFQGWVAAAGIYQVSGFWLNIFSMAPDVTGTPLIVFTLHRRYIDKKGKLYNCWGESIVISWNKAFGPCMQRCWSRACANHIPKWCGAASSKVSSPPLAQDENWFLCMSAVFLSWCGVSSVLRWSSVTTRWSHVVCLWSLSTVHWVMVGWVAPSVAIADGAVDCGSGESATARWSHVASTYSKFVDLCDSKTQRRPPALRKLCQRSKM